MFKSCLEHEKCPMIKGLKCEYSKSYDCIHKDRF